MTKTKHEETEDAIADYHAAQLCTNIDNDVLYDLFEIAGEKRIYTSYYARSSGHERAVSISASAPTYFKGNHIKTLAPTWEILDAYKAGKIDENEYAKRYISLLEDERKLTPLSVYNAIPNGTILLCYEKAGDFCHRRVLAEWVEKSLGVIIPEWESEDERKKLAHVESLLEF